MLANEAHVTTPTITVNHYHKPVYTVKPMVSKPSRGVTDDLKAIKGIGAVIEKALNAEGIYYYRQIAHFTAANVEWVNSHLDFAGRIEREEWIAQAKALLPQEDTQVPESVPDTLSDTMKPALLDKPLNTGADDLKRIKGIGRVLEQDLQQLGIYHYQQLATLTAGNAKWVDQQIGFPGRLQRENWIAQARALMNGNRTEYSKRFDQGETPYKD